MSESPLSVPYDPALKVLIEWLTKMADQTDGRAESAITLNVGGMLVSGHVTTARQFMLSHSLTDRFVEVLESEFKHAGIFTDDGREYIHLSDAKFFVPGQRPIPQNVDGVFWRGRLSKISGFWFGHLRAEEVGTGEHESAQPGEAD